MMESLVNKLSPGAFALLTVPADMGLWSAHDTVHGHFRRYTQCSFERLWADLPVETLLLSYFNSRLYPAIRIMRSISRWSGGTWGRAGTDVFMPPSVVNRLLTEVFAGESSLLAEILKGRRKQGFARGVSLVAVVRKAQASS